MSNYKPNLYVDYSKAPDILMEFIRYSESIKRLSPKTCRGYFIDLQLFFRFLIQKSDNNINNDTIDTIDISNIDREFVSNISRSDILNFLHFVSTERNNSAASVSRKLSSIRSYFKYIYSKMNYIPTDPSEHIDTPSVKKRLPKYLSVDQSLSLLNNIQTDFTERDYCMILLFLSCGMRLSELVGIDLSDIRDDTIRIIGKGNKERTVYLNDSCIAALEEYISIRNTIVSPVSQPALFISKRTKKRISDRRVEQIVENCLKASGLDKQGFSTHKLRHTAATQLYRYGGADVLALKEILGHEHVNTTEIYTHLDDESVKKVAKSSPLANVKKSK